MPSPTRGKVIHITVTNATAGDRVKVTNLTSGGTIIGKVDSNGQITLNSSNISTSWGNDTVQAEIHGRINQVGTGTINKGGVSITLNNEMDVDTPGVDA